MIGLGLVLSNAFDDLVGILFTLSIFPFYRVGFSRTQLHFLNEKILNKSFSLCQLISLGVSCTLKRFCSPALYA